MRRAAIQCIDLRLTGGVVCTEMAYKLHEPGAHFVENTRASLPAPARTIAVFQHVAAFAFQQLHLFEALNQEA